MLEILIYQLQADTPPSDLDYDTMQVLLAPDGVSGIHLGYSCAISSDGRIIALGAPNGRRSSIPAGAVYVYEKIGDSYTWIQKLTASDGAANDYLGFSVAISGDGSTISIGTYADDDKGSSSGSMYVFKHEETQYREVKKLTGNKNVANGNFGRSVAIAEDTQQIVVGGENWTDGAGVATGSGFVFS